MRSIIDLFLSVSIYGCKPVALKHEVDYKKVGDDCTGRNTQVQLKSNIGGDRYEFQECLDNDFDGKNYTAERRGDTILVNFNKARTGKKQALFNIILDIDAYPRYKVMSISGNTFDVVPAPK